MTRPGLVVISVVLLFYGLLGAESACPDGWVHYKTDCYFFGHHDVTFIEGQRFCKHYDAHLVIIDNADENNFIANELQELNSERHWIGLTDEIVEGVWRWYETNAVANFTDWYPGQPDLGGRANCADILSAKPYAYHWLDDECTYKYRPICEKRLITESEVIGK